MKEITATGPTVEEAVQSALAQLNTSKDRAEITIVDEGKKGLFGLFGSKPSVVTVKLKQDPIEESTNFLKKVLTEMNIVAELDVKVEGRNISISISGEKTALIIGKRGQTLNSLQYLTQIVANRYSNQYLNVVIDAEGYREKRRETLEQLAERLAQKALKTKQDVHLEPMPSFERKVMHSIISAYPEVETYSVGKEPNRSLVITTKKNKVAKR
ncbi:RNA-binding cell elongation regulator Jag/EloR [Sutcliffiella horikoshii]|uniref:RNA-binding protein KhpB n=1 Tax=Sutcliffiella horikoshii TaxID=79883 RepID=A0A1Y0CSY1_9BACI|nr:MULTISPECIES: RNA-binding cell elongation regulator Jag/EloR [Bacillaceae]ART78481.1 protein jag [Sutcliffiella horikoshii]TYS59586.1 protein jag [Sutcliffiella horikoshii]TYS70276.1 protein jag [Sutcliffiella horikoshii]UAL47451.1 protein jag [Sutcliffiella horikoshii]